MTSIRSIAHSYWYNIAFCDNTSRFCINTRTIHYWQILSFLQPFTFVFQLEQAFISFSE